MGRPSPQRTTIVPSLYAGVVRSTARIIGTGVPATWALLVVCCWRHRAALLEGSLRQRVDNLPGLHVYPLDRVSIDHPRRFAEQLIDLGQQSFDVQAVAWARVDRVAQFNKIRSQRFKSRSHVEPFMSGSTTTLPLGLAIRN